MPLHECWAVSYDINNDEDKPVEFFTHLPTSGELRSDVEIINIVPYKSMHSEHVGDRLKEKLRLQIKLEEICNASLPVYMS